MKHDDYIEMHLAKHEYIEGSQALANFNRVATAVFQSKKKISALVPVKAEKASSRKSGKGKAS